MLLDSRLSVEGALPQASLLLMRSSGSGKNVSCKQFIHTGLMIDESEIYFFAGESLEDSELFFPSKDSKNF